MKQVTLTQMWDESFDDDISTLNSANESTVENGSINSTDSIGNDKHFKYSPGEHSSHSSQDTVPVVYDNSSVIDGISFESTQINVTAQLLTQDFHTSPNNENAANVSNNTNHNEDLSEEEVTEGYLAENEIAEDEIAEDDIDEEEIAEDEIADDEIAEDEIAEDLAEDEYHYFLQTHLGLYHDNLAHQEQFEYLVWVLEKYDEFLTQNK